MQVEGVSAVSVSSGAIAAAAQPGSNTGVNSPTAIGDSNTSDNNAVAASDNANKEEVSQSGAPQPLKSMATADFLSLHDVYNNQDNVMNKLLKILEAVLALELLDKTLEAAKESDEQTGFKGIA